MAESDTSGDLVRTRREPAPFRRVTVQSVVPLSAHMVRVTLVGRELEGFVVDQPATSVRLLLPPPETQNLVMPTWNGNEFLLPDGRRALIRTFTPRPVVGDEPLLALDVVVHEGGAVSGWALRARSGDPAAVSGPGRGYAIDRSAPAFLLAGDETAIPAIRQLLEALPAETPVHVLIEVAHPDARLSLPDHPGATVEWYDIAKGADPGEALVAAVHSAELTSGTRVWAAGNAAAMQQIRRYLFEDRGWLRSNATVRGYWKAERALPSDGAPGAE
jgi:NADPH-dependent ferric siderophore reductase